MAPSTRGARVSKRQAPLRAFTKVTKATTQQVTAKALACEEFVSPLLEVPPPRKNDAKRKRSLGEDDSEAESEKPSVQVAKAKKVWLVSNVNISGILIAKGKVRTPQSTPFTER